MEQTQRLVAREDALDLAVEAVMLSRPKTFPTNATVGEARRLFLNESIRAALLVDGSTFVAMVVRADLPDTAADGEPVLAYGNRDAARARPGTLVRDAMQLIEGASENRLVVAGEDDTFHGLVCLRRSVDAFLVDE
jgi:predicted transcriptional regulator